MTTLPLPLSLKGCLSQSPAVECLRRSKALYAMHELVGSDDKDICGERKAKIIGATVNASEQAQSRGRVLVSAPAEKRYALSWITLQILPAHSHLRLTPPVCFGRLDFDIDVP